MSEKIDLYSMTDTELADFFVSIGEPKFRAKQVFAELHRGKSVDEITTLSKALRAKLAEISLDTLPKVELKLTSKIDGTVKYLFKLYDGSTIESVLMRYKYGLTVCISSQVGCRMGCRFCASTIDGKVRDLLPSELLGQIIAASRDAGERISHVVMMGIGEPLDNYGNVIKFLRLVNMQDGLGISYRNISVSTCGIVPKIEALAEEDLPITLSISLHAATDEKRSEIMPVNNAYGVAYLLSACNSYFEKTGRRISFEYTLIAGKNDSREEAERLAAVLKKYMSGPIHVNLIRVNEVKETGFKQGSTESANNFAKTLERYGVVATVRRKLGSDVNAACGQLRRASAKNEENN